MESFLEGLSDASLAALPWVFEFWALPHQLPPEGEWKTWTILGGRGAGKTRAGAEWVRSMVEGGTREARGRARRVALIRETYDQALAVMVKGESGILACSPPDRRPRWIAGERKLVWPNGAEAQVFSAYAYEALRGPQFDAAWVDELAKWPKAQEAWDMLQFGLRLGDHPQQVVTTTPRNLPVLKDLIVRKSTVVTHAPTDANRAYLAPSFLEEVRERYGNSRLGRQELDGELLEDVDGALWTRAALDEARVSDLPEGLDVTSAWRPAAPNSTIWQTFAVFPTFRVKTGKCPIQRARAIDQAGAADERRCRGCKGLVGHALYPSGKLQRGGLRLPWVAAGCVARNPRGRARKRPCLYGRLVRAFGSGSALGGSLAASDTQTACPSRLRGHFAVSDA